MDDKAARTWHEAVAQWLMEKSHKCSISKDREIFRWLEPYLGDFKLCQIDRAKLAAIAAVKASQTSPINANRNMALVRAVLRRARDVWEWIERAPKVPTYSVDSRRIRWLTRSEAATLLSHLPPHQSAMARFALATGLRQRNVCRLKWANVDLPGARAWIHAEQSKNKKPLVVPLNRDALAVLEAQLGRHPEYVFVYQGNPVWQVNTGSWRRAVKAAGLTDFRWHDLRHTWASWHVQSGTPCNVLQELGGWASYEMVRRYAHLSISHLAPYAERITAV